MFDLHLLQLLHQWRAEGDETILAGDLNIHVYNDPLVHALKEEDICLQEQFNKVFDEDVPFLHLTGSKPIASFFATPGIDCVTAYVSKHKVNGGPGVGDHRVMVFDFSAESIIGLDAPAANPPEARKLCAGVDRWRVENAKSLLKLASHHRMYTKMNYLKENREKMSEVEFLLLFNKWDVEYTQLITAAESKCRKYKNDHISFSPGIGLLIQ